MTLKKKESVGHKFCAVGKWTYEFCPERLSELENRTFKGACGSVVG
jgi:hypothetical protein